MSVFCCDFVDAASIPNPYPATESGVRLTPEVSKKPAINGAKVYGARPGSPILYHVAVSGERPMKIVAQKLPAGLKMDAQGNIRGKISAKGTYPITIGAVNKHGKATDIITLKIGEDLCLTPPMGWNSWYSYSEAINQENILHVANLFVEKGLVNHGWSFVNIDDCWQGERGGPMKAIQSNKKFPDMKGMCDKIHKMGLKAGIYSTPWIGSYAGFIGGSAPNEKGGYAEFAIPEAQRHQPTQFFGTWPGLTKQKVDHVGPVWFFDKDAKQWAQWGFDYVKVDWLPNDVPTTERVYNDLRQSGRDIVLSLSNAAPFQNVEGLKKFANLWRTTGDIRDNWGGISRVINDDKWFAHTSSGHWNDPDILQIGRIGEAGKNNASFRPTNLTPDEQYAQISLWSLLSAPLIMSSDLANLDDFTLGLITNDDVIAVNQDPAGKAAKKAINQGALQVITKELANGDLAVGFFNTGDNKETFTVKLSDLGLSGTQSVRDLWKRATVGTTKDTVTIELNKHGVVLFLFKKA
ncbi:MAG: glycoside hydrolase family 27 protein [Akkermansia sp.]